MILYFYALLFYASIVQAFGANQHLTLDHYRVIFSEGLPAIKDTLIIAMIGMPLGGLYGIVVGYLVGRTQISPAARPWNSSACSTMPCPARSSASPILLAFNDKPLALTGTATILIACYVFRYSPTGIRTTIALLQQIDRSMEEASASLGASSIYNVPARDAAADHAGFLRRPWRGLHPLDDGDQRHDLSGVDRLDADHRQDPGEHDRGCAGPGGGFLGLRDRRRPVRDGAAQRLLGYLSAPEPCASSRIGT